MKGGTLLYNPGTGEITRCPPGYVQDIFGGECISDGICAMAERETLWYSLFKGEMSGITEVMSAAVKALAANTTGSNKSCDGKPGRYGYPTTEECRPECTISNTLLKRDAPKPDTLFLWGR